MNWHGIFRTFHLFITKRSLSDQDRSHLNVHVEETEKRTGAQIILSVIERCDAYPELPWKAFALGVALSSLIILAMDILRPVWLFDATVLLAIVITLSAGAGCALLCIFVPGFARFFLDEERSEMEVRQYGESLFLSREIFATHKRTGILFLIGLFERQVIILPDAGLVNRLNQTDLQKIISQMTHTLSSGQIAEALEQGLKGLEKAFSETKPLTPEKNELPDEIIEEEGS
jgi:putative membrane protein